jgi:outer membrane cobalamin receptor
VGRRSDSDFSSLEPPLLENAGYAVWDVRGSYRVVRRLSATVAIDNLADSDHMEPLGYPVLGRAIRFGVRARF